MGDFWAFLLIMFLGIVGIPATISIVGHVIGSPPSYVMPVFLVGAWLALLNAWPKSVAPAGD